MRERKEQAHGPYRRGRRWRVVETSAIGRRATCSFKTEAEARDYIARFNDTAEGRKVSGVIDAYLEKRRADGIVPATITTWRYRLKSITGVIERDRLLSMVTPVIAAEWYAARVATQKVDTHRGELAAVKAMFAWCVESKWLRASPFADVKPVGRKAVRTDHLRIDETRAFVEAAMSDATDAGIAVVLAVLFGLRASEVVGLRVRDVDDGARVLWVDGTKSDAARRSFEVPGWLRKRLTRRIEKRAGTERLFGVVTRRWLSYHVARICDLAGIAGVSPHALRRTWAALGAERHSMHDVSRALGHTSSAITRRHYQPTNAEERRTSGVVLRAVKGGAS